MLALRVVIIEMGCSNGLDVTERWPFYEMETGVMRLRDGIVTEIRCLTQLL